MEVIDQENVKIPNSLTVRGITNTEEGDAITEYLSRYGHIDRVIQIDDPDSEYHKNLIIEFESGSAL